MKKVIMLFLGVVCLLACTSCDAREEENLPEPRLSHMKSICELSVMECYYHNVAKYDEKDAERFLFWTKDKKFWIEYSGIVKLGIDASLVTMEINGDEVAITIPEAQVLSCNVDSSSLTEDSFIIDQDSARISAEDEIKAFDVAQRDMEETASNDRALLNSAQQRAQTLLENCPKNIGEPVGKAYSVRFVPAG